MSLSLRFHWQTLPSHKWVDITMERCWQMDWCCRSNCDYTELSLGDSGLRWATQTCLRNKTHPTRIKCQSDRKTTRRGLSWTHRKPRLQHHLKPCFAVSFNCRDTVVGVFVWVFLQRRSLLDGVPDARLATHLPVIPSSGSWGLRELQDNLLCPTFSLTKPFLFSVSLNCQNIYQNPSEIFIHI